MAGWTVVGEGILDDFVSCDVDVGVVVMAVGSVVIIYHAVVQKEVDCRFPVICGAVADSTAYFGRVEDGPVFCWGDGDVCYSTSFRPHITG